MKSFVVSINKTEFQNSEARASLHPAGIILSKNIWASSVQKHLFQIDKEMSYYSLRFFKNASVLYRCKEVSRIKSIITNTWWLLVFTTNNWIRHWYPENRPCHVVKKYPMVFSIVQYSVQYLAVRAFSSDKKTWLISDGMQNRPSTAGYLGGTVSPQGTQDLSP